MKLRIVPHIDELFFSFFGVVQSKFKVIATAALAQYETRKEEQRQFFEALDEVGLVPPMASCRVISSFDLLFRDCFAMLLLLPSVFCLAPSLLSSGQEAKPPNRLRARRLVPRLQREGIVVRVPCCEFYERRR
jgi:hypothetical protein